MAKDTPKNTVKIKKEDAKRKSSLVVVGAGAAVLAAIVAWVIATTKNIFNYKDKPGK